MIYIPKLKLTINHPYKINNPSLPSEILNKINHFTHVFKPIYKLNFIHTTPNHPIYCYPNNPTQITIQASMKTITKGNEMSIQVFKQSIPTMTNPIRNMYPQVLWCITK